MSSLDREIPPADLPGSAMRESYSLGSFLRVTVGPGVPQKLRFCSCDVYARRVWTCVGSGFHFRCRIRWRQGYMRVTASIKMQQHVVESSFSSAQVPLSSSTRLALWGKKKISGFLDSGMVYWERIIIKCCVKPRTAWSALAFRQQPFC